MKVIIGCDHGGFELKEFVRQFLSKEMHMDLCDIGTHSIDSVDYPDFGRKVAEQIQKGEFDRGILICGTGIGMSIVANRYPKIRAALCHDAYTAKMSREHNDANVLIIGGRVIEKEHVKEMIQIWFSSEFQGGRHQKRLEKIDVLETGICDSLSV